MCVCGGKIVPFPLVSNGMLEISCTAKASVW